VLRAETERFGIRTLVVEPSGFRTDWAGRSMDVAAMPAEYADIAERYAASDDPSSTLQADDPERAAEILVRLVEREQLPHNLPIGVNATRLSTDFDRAQLESDLRWEQLGRSADFGQPYPVAIPD